MERMGRVTSEATSKLSPEEIRHDIVNWLSAIATINTASPREPIAEYSAMSQGNPFRNGAWHPEGRAVYSLFAPFWLNVIPLGRGFDLEHVEYAGSTKIQPLDNENVLYTSKNPFMDGTYIDVAQGEQGITVSIQTEDRQRNASMQDSSPIAVVDAVELPISAIERVQLEVVRHVVPMSFDRPRV